MHTDPERRTQPRYHTKERTLLATGPGRENTYHLLDISQSGLGFRYIGEDARIPELQRISLFINGELRIGDVEVHLVRDTPLMNGMISFRRCGLRFENLSPKQAEKLKSFVAEVATGEA